MTTASAEPLREMRLYPDGNRPPSSAATPSGAVGVAESVGTVIVLLADRIQLVDFPAPGTPEWGRMNQRRAELIRKKNRGRLTPAEQLEYDRLQRLSHQALETSFPRPSLGPNAGDGHQG